MAYDLSSRGSSSALQHRAWVPSNPVGFRSNSTVVCPQDTRATIERWEDLDTPVIVVVLMIYSGVGWLIFSSHLGLHYENQSFGKKHPGQYKFNFFKFCDPHMYFLKIKSYTTSCEATKSSNSALCCLRGLSDSLTTWRFLPSLFARTPFKKLHFIYQWKSLQLLKMRRTSYSA